MAEENAAKEEGAKAPEAPAPAQGQKPTLFIILAIVNMLVVGGVGAMLYLSKQKEAMEPGIDDVIQGEAEKQKAEEETSKFIGELIPLETFLVNLAGARGRKLVKINMEFEVDGDQVQEEVDKLKPKIRDIVIIILSSKTYEQVSKREGKESLRAEIKDQVNLFLTKGEVKSVYFTEFITN